MNVLSIRAEIGSDLAFVEKLLDRSFGTDRRRKVSYRYRFGVAPVKELCQVALDADERLVGAIRYWPILVQRQHSLLLGPVAIDPDRRGQGIGRLLIETTLQHAAERGWPSVFLVGERSYYGQFGFAAAPAGLIMPGEQSCRVLARNLAGMALPTEGVMMPWNIGRSASGQTIALIR